MSVWLQKYAANVASAYGLRFVQMGLSVAAIPLLLSFIGTEGFGVVIFLSSIIGYLGLFDFGISGTLAKTVGEVDALENKTELNEQISSALFFFFGVGLSVFILACAVVYFLSLMNWWPSSDMPWDRLTLLTALLGIFALPHIALQGIYQGLQAQPIMNLVMSIGRIAAVGSAIFAAWNGASVEHVFLLFNFDKFILVVVLIGLLFFQRTDIQIGPAHFSWARLRSLFGFGRWIMLAKMATFLEYQLDNLLVMVVGGPVAVAAYTVITTPFRMIQQVSGLAAQAIVPVVSGKALSEGDKIIMQIQTTGVRWHNALLAATWVLCLINADFLLNLWLQGRFSEHYWLIKVLIAFQAIWQANAFMAMVATGLGHVRPLGIIAIWTGVANFVLSVVLVNFFGFYGVIYGTLIAGVGAAPIAAILLARLTQTPLSKYLGTCIRGQLPAIIIATLVMIAAWSGLSDILLFVISGMLIAGTYALLYIWQRPDRQKKIPTTAL